MRQVGGHSCVEHSERRCSDNEKFHSVSPLTTRRKSGESTTTALRIYFGNIGVNKSAAAK
jgi:hypothetical protein